MGPEDNPVSHQPSGLPSTNSGGSHITRPNVSNGSQPLPDIDMKKLAHVHSSSITKMKESLDDSNWVVWHKRICHIFHLCGVEPYVYGTIGRPDPALDQGLYDIWDANDVYAHILITNNITKDQMVHVTRLNTAHEIWKSLEAIHETKDYQIAIAIQRNLFRKCATEGDDVVEHLTQLKKQWKRLNVLNNADFHITDIQFKTIIASSLLSSWNSFMEPYVGQRVGVTETDPKKLTSSQELIRILKEEYLKRKEWNATAQIFYTNNQSLGKCNRGQCKSTGTQCQNCKHNSHTTDNCRWLGKPKCDKCGWFGHVGANCCRNLK